MSYVDLRAYLRYDSAWNDISDRVYGESETISIERGARNEGSAGDTTSVDLKLKNGDGRFSTRNPTSLLYGKIGRNTQLRVGIGEPHVGAEASSVPASTSHVAPSVDAPTDSGILICAWGNPEPSNSPSPPGGMTAAAARTDFLATLRTAAESLGSSGATGTRTATVSTSESYLSTSVVLPGSSPAVQFTGGGSGSSVGPISAVAGVWWVYTAMWLWNDPNGGIIPDYPGDTDGGGWILLADTGVVETADFHGDFAQMRTWAKRVRHTRTDHFVAVDLLNDLGSGIPGAAVISKLHDWKQVAGVDDWDIRATVEVPSWPPRRDTSGRHRFLPVRASGVMRRLGRDGTPLLSTMHREVLKPVNAAVVAAYWPCEDEEGATSIASAVAQDSRPMTVSGEVSLSSYTGFPGSLPLPVLGADGRLGGQVSGMPDGLCYARALFFIPEAGLDDGRTILEIGCAGGAVDRLRLRYGTGGSLRLQADDSDGATIDTLGPFATDVDGRQFLVSVEAVQDGSDLDVLYHLRYVTADGEVEVGGIPTDTWTTTLGRVRSMHVARRGSMDGAAAGHLMMGTAQQLVFSITDALTGYTGERAGNRIRRLCMENGVAFARYGDLGQTVHMGAERTPATLMQLLRDCEEADMGHLVEPREFLGIAYVPRRDKYNRPAAATLDYAQHQVVTPFEPEPDDLLIANDITVSRPGGSSAQAVQTEGPLNVNAREDDPQGVGRMPGTASVRILSDGNLRHQAGWRLREGTTDEPRFSQISTDLVREAQLGDPDLPAAVAALDVGNRMLVTGPPTDDLPPDDVDQTVVGYRETLSQVRRRIDLVTVPQSPNRVLVWQGAGATPAADDPARYDSGGSSVASSFDAGTDTSLSVAVADGHPLWTTSVGASGFDIMVSGVRLHVTAISGSSSPQTFTVDATPVNGVAKTIPAGERVRLWASAAWAL